MSPLDRLLSRAALLKVALLLICAVMVSQTGCVDAPAEEPPPALEAVEGPPICDTVRVDVWVRFWRDGQELACDQVVTEGYQLEAGILGEAFDLDVALGWCAAQVQPDRRRRVGTSVWTITNAAAGRNLAVRATGPDGSVEHTLMTTACGRTGSQALSIVLPPTRGI